MKLRFLNNTLENRRFDYNPRYYDDRKEMLERKKEYYEKLKAGELSDDARRTMFRENIKGEFNRSEYRQVQNKSANLRVIGLILILTALGYFIFNGLDDVDTIVNKLW